MGMGKVVDTKFIYGHTDTDRGIRQASFLVHISRDRKRPRPRHCTVLYRRIQDFLLSFYSFLLLLERKKTGFRFFFKRKPISFLMFPFTCKMKREKH